MTIGAPDGIGSLWRRWDLHIHTPASIVQHYGGTDNWDRFLADLANMPPELSVIGINDYLFIDGYRRVLGEWQQGRLPNIEAVFPVVEFRLQHLAGIDGDIGRINYHVIFDAAFDADVIEAQFLHGLSAKFQLTSPGSAPWSGFLTRANVEGLGSAVRSALPVDRQAEHNENDLHLGFNNLVLHLDELQEVLGHTALAGRTMCAIGKAEWSSLRWTDQAIATKKHLINGADIVFTAAASSTTYDAGRAALKAQQVNDRLLDCSDAHHFAAAQEKDRIGNSFSWLRCQPTLDGLRHAVSEFDHRVFVGDTPAKVARLRSRPGDYMRSVSIRRASTVTEDVEAMFAVDLPLNPGFVAVVGNKGKGKSALLDVLGLAGDSAAEASFTFLSKERFRKPLANRAIEHEVELSWCDGEVAVRNLDDSTSPGAPERVTYLPQRLLDEICSADPGEPAERFARELGQVLFAHVPLPDRLGTTGLEDLITSRSDARNERLAALRLELSDMNRAIVDLEELLRPEHRTSAKERLALLERKLSAFDETEPVVPPDPQDGGDAALAGRVQELQTAIDGAEQEIAALRAEDSQLALRLDAADQLGTALTTLQSQTDALRTAQEHRSIELGINYEDLVKVTIDREPLEAVIRDMTERRHVIRNLVDDSVPDGPGSRIVALRAERAEAAAQLDEPARLHAAAVAAHAEWAAGRLEIVEGSEDEPGLEPTKSELLDLEQAPEELEALRSERQRLVRSIHEALLDKVRIYEELYGPARDFIAEHEIARVCDLTFGAALRERNLERRFFDLVNRGVAGTFTGLEEGAQVLRDSISSTDFSLTDPTIAFVETLSSAVHEDQRSSPPSPVDTTRLVRAGHTVHELYDLIFGLSYLEPFHSLRYQGIALDQLSPGEKGTLLLVFYLLVDPARTPLLLDQPDENLDNHTIKDVLVPAIKEASARRQVVVVTHNPNVAIVADADQVVVAERRDHEFVYSSGAIEDNPINLSAVDVLEGTWPALDNRTGKYQRPSD